MDKPSVLLLALIAGLSALVNWGLNHQQKTLLHLMIGPNHYWLVGQKARLFDEQFQPRATYQAVFKALYDSQK